MTKVSQDTAMGIGIVLVCLMLMTRDRWFLAETSKGRRLVAWLGETWGLWVLRGVLLALAALGALLASGLIRPIRWERTAADSTGAPGLREPRRRPLHHRPAEPSRGLTELVACSLRHAPIQ